MNCFEVLYQVSLLGKRLVAAGALVWPDSAMLSVVVPHIAAFIEGHSAVGPLARVKGVILTLIRIEHLLPNVGIVLVEGFFLNYLITLVIFDFRRLELLSRSESIFKG